MVTAVFQCLSRYLRLILVFGTLLALISCGGEAVVVDHQWCIQA